MTTKKTKKTKKTIADQLQKLREKHLEETRVLLMESSEVNRIADILERETQLWAKENGFPKKENKTAKAKEPKMSEKARKIQEMFNKNYDLFGCQTHAAAKLVSVLLGEKIVLVAPREELPEYRFRFRLGAVFVVIGNPNAHNYPIKKPVLTRGDRNEVCFTPYLDDRRDCGNNAPSEKSAVRPATRAEIMLLVADSLFHANPMFQEDFKRIVSRIPK